MLSSIKGKYQMRQENNPAGIWIGPENFDSSVGGSVEFALDFISEKNETFQFYVTADQYYILYCDGEIIGRSNERGTLNTWFLDELSCKSCPGRHTLTAQIWHCGESSAALVESRSLGFFLSAPMNEERFSTGRAPWKMRRLSGVSFSPHPFIPNGWIGVHPELRIDWRQLPSAWGSPSVKTDCGGNLVMPMIDRLPEVRKEKFLLPVYVDKISSAQICCDRNQPENLIMAESLADNGKIEIPANSTLRIIYRMADYSCGWPLLRVAGGQNSEIVFSYAETLFSSPDSMEKDLSDQIDKKYFRGISDHFLLDGSAHMLMPLVWRSGNYLQITVSTGSESMTLQNLCWIESVCPLPIEGDCRSANPRWNHLIERCIHTFRMNSHDRFMDCPYYEQLSYTGDGRIEALVSYVMTRDDRLAKKMLILFAETCEQNPFCCCRTPSSGHDLLPSFALWFPAMVYDFALWRNDRNLVKQLLPAVRSNNRYFLNQINPDGLFRFEKNKFRKEGRYWNFIDWIPAWTNGRVCGDSLVAEDGFNTTINWLLVYSLRLSARLEEEFGDAEVAADYGSAASRIASSLQQYLDPAKGLFNTRGIPGEYAEHTQILAVLSGIYRKDDMRLLFKRMLAHPGIARVSLFFDHYLWLAGKEVGELSVFGDRLKDFLNVLDHGSRTLPETFHHSRSECHGWGAMPVFHLISTVGGIRPGCWGFSSVIVEPEESAIGKELKVCCVHPGGGMIRAHFRNTDSAFQADIELPPGLNGTFLWNKCPFPLKSGKQQLVFQKRNEYEKKQFSDSPIVR